MHKQMTVSQKRRLDAFSKGEIDYLDAHGDTDLMETLDNQQDYIPELHGHITRVDTNPILLDEEVN
jgi:hypothetical protein